MANQLKTFLSTVFCGLLITAFQPTVAAPNYLFATPEGGDTPLCTEGFNEVSALPTLERIESELSPMCYDFGGDRVEHRIMHGGERSHVIFSCTGSEEVMFDCAFPITENPVVFTPQLRQEG